jgi:hypothetical protein
MAHALKKRSHDTNGKDLVTEISKYSWKKAAAFFAGPMYATRPSDNKHSLFVWHLFLKKINI